MATTSPRPNPMPSRWAATPSAARTHSRKVSRCPVATSTYASRSPMRSTVASIISGTIATVPGTTVATGAGVISPAEDDGAVGAKPTTGPADTGGTGSGHLAFAALASQLAYRLDQQEQA